MCSSGCGPGDEVVELVVGEDARREVVPEVLEGYL